MFFGQVPTFEKCQGYNVRVKPSEGIWECFIVVEGAPSSEELTPECDGGQGTAFLCPGLLIS